MITNNFGKGKCLNGKKDCSKILAFCITKYINPNAEINDIFDTIRED